MSSQPSWRPNLPEFLLFEEKTLLQGAILSAVAYGVTLALFILIISLLITRLKVDRKHGGRASRLTTCLLIYVCVMFILSTLSMASEAEVIQLLFVEYGDSGGGPPAAHQNLMLSTPTSSLGYFCFVIMNWFSDGLLLWRCSVIYRSSRTSVWLVMAIPGLMLLASFVTGTIFLEKISRPSASPSTSFELIYLTVALGLNIVLTLMIVIRLYLHRRRFTKLLGRRHTSHYTGIISMLIESAAVLVVLALWLLITLALDNPLANIPTYCISQAQTAASYMIIFRVAKGTAWTSRTAYESELTIPDMPEQVGALSNIRFQTGSGEHPVTSQPRTQFPLDGSRDVLDTEPNSRRTVYERSPRDPAGVIARAGPMQIEVCNTE